MESHDERTAETRTQQVVDYSVALPALNYRERTVQDAPLGRGEPFHFSHWSRRLAVTCEGMFHAARDAKRLCILGPDTEGPRPPVVLAGEEVTVRLEPAVILFEWLENLGSTLVYENGKRTASVFKEGASFEMTPSSLAIRLPRPDAMLRFALTLSVSTFRLVLNRREREEEIFGSRAEGESITVLFSPEDVRRPLEILAQQRDLSLAAGLLDRFETKPLSDITEIYRSNLSGFVSILLGEAHTLTRIAAQLEARDSATRRIADERGSRISHLAARTRRIALGQTQPEAPPGFVISGSIHTSRAGISVGTVHSLFTWNPYSETSSLFEMVPDPSPLTGFLFLSDSELSNAGPDFLSGCEGTERITDGAFAGYTALFVRSRSGRERYAILDTTHSGNAIYIFRVTDDERWRQTITLTKTAILTADPAETCFVMRLVHGPAVVDQIARLLEQ